MRSYYSEGGLRKWVSEKWVDIGAPKKDGKYQPCGRSKGSKEKTSKMRANLQKHTDDKGQKAGAAVRRKRAAGNQEETPTNVATFAKKKKS